MMLRLLQQREGILYVLSAKTVGFLCVEERDLEPLDANVVLSIEDNVVRALDTILVY